MSVSCTGIRQGSPGRVADLDPDPAGAAPHAQAEDPGTGVAYGVADQLGDEEDGVLRDLGAELPLTQGDDLGQPAGGGGGLGPGG